MENVSDMFKKKIVSVIPLSSSTREFNQALNCRVRFTKEEARQILTELRDDGLINLKRKKGFFIEKL